MNVYQMLKYMYVLHGPMPLKYVYMIRDLRRKCKVDHSGNYQLSLALTIIAELKTFEQAAQLLYSEAFSRKKSVSVLSPYVA